MITAGVPARSRLRDGDSAGHAIDLPDMLDPERDGNPQRVSHLIITIDPEVIDIDGDGPSRLARLRQNVIDPGDELADLRVQRRARSHPPTTDEDER